MKCGGCTSSFTAGLNRKAKKHEPFIQHPNKIRYVFTSHNGFTDDPQSAFRHIDTIPKLEKGRPFDDIACPLCREKYGNTNGKHQEEEGASLVTAFLSDSEMTKVQIDRVAFLVGHHHTFTGIDSLDWQILIEADYIANATENGYSETNVRNFIQEIMKTDSGKSLAKDVFA